MRLHNRRDLEYTVIRGTGRFSRAAYACVITQSTAFPGVRCLYHIGTFYGADARKVRSQACRYGRELRTGRTRVASYRNQTLPSNFPRVPWVRENEVEIPE